MTTQTTTNTATDTHNADMRLMALLDPTFRTLLAGLAYDDTMNWIDANASDFQLYSDEMDALRDLCDLSYSQFNLVAEAAYRLASEELAGGLQAKGL